MPTFIDRIRSVSRMRNLIRRARTWYWKRWYGVAGVDISFLLNPGCDLASDFVAGPYGYMNSGCRISPRVRVGKYVMFGPDVMITGSDHHFDEPGVPINFSGRPELPQTLIGDDCWLGARCIIMAGIEIGRGSIIASGAIVTKSVEPYSVIAGVPARVIRKRFPTEEGEQIHDAMLAEPPHGGEFCEPKK